MKSNNRSKKLIIPALSLTFATVFSAPALAHHPLGGNAPSNWIQGFLSGMGHPIIGQDHLIFTIIIGLLATRFKPFWVVPVAFLTTALAGTGLYLMDLDLPAPEFIVALSVVVFGLLIAYGHRLEVGSVSLLSAIAGIFHGYAYGEAIVGATIAPLISYLVGFTLIQGVVIMVAFGIARKRATLLRYTGFIAVGVGFGFLSSLVLG